MQASVRISPLSKYRLLLEDEWVRKWVDCVARGSRHGRGLLPQAG
jgi:hypothetical protein